MMVKFIPTCQYKRRLGAVKLLEQRVWHSQWNLAAHKTYNSSLYFYDDLQTAEFHFAVAEMWENTAWLILSILIFKHATEMQRIVSRKDTTLSFWWCDERFVIICGFQNVSYCISQRVGRKWSVWRQAGENRRSCKICIDGSCIVVWCGRMRDM